MTRLLQTIGDLNSHGYKEISIRHHPNFTQFLVAQEIVRTYIQDNSLILYGGMAVDFAMRLKGDQIYNDDDLPDYDFFAPDNVKAARELVDLLRAKIGADINIYAGRALYVRTMRVAVGPNNWVADISYIPPKLFAQIPTMIFDGLRFVHPHFQFNDLHSSLAFPYDDAPREAIFARWTKDIERFNKLYAMYPLEAQSRGIATSSKSVRETVLPRDIMSHTVLQGFAAYSAYFAAIEPYLHRANLGEIIHAEGPSIDRDGDVRLHVPHSIVELIAHRNIRESPWFKTQISRKSVREFRAFLDLTDHSLRAETKAKDARANLHIYFTIGRYIGYNTITLRGVEKSSLRVRIVSIPALLKFFISAYVRAKYFEDSRETHNAAIFATYYQSCMTMIALSRKLDPEVRELFDPAITTFGEISPTPSSLLDAFTTFTRASGGDADAVAQVSALPRTLRDDMTTFDYNSCPFMQISGEEISRTK